MSISFLVIWRWKRRKYDRNNFYIISLFQLLNLGVEFFEALGLNHSPKKLLVATKLLSMSL